MKFFGVKYFMKYFVKYFWNTLPFIHLCVVQLPKAPFIATQLNSTSSWVVSWVALDTLYDARRRSPTRALSGTQPVSAKQVSSLFITLILLLYSSISLFSNSPVQLSLISIRSYSQSNSRISWLFYIIHDVMIHKLLELGHDVQNRRHVEPPTRRRRIDNWQLSWVELSWVVSL